MLPHQAEALHSCWGSWMAPAPCKPDLQVGKLDAVLAPPMLGHWQGQARAAKAAGR